MADKDYCTIVKTAGLGGDEEMIFYHGVNSCGQITDGVGFDIGRGSWVVSFKDLESMYVKADQCRQEWDSIK